MHRAGETAQWLKILRNKCEQPSLGRPPETHIRHNGHGSSLVITALKVETGDPRSKLASKTSS